MTMRGHASAAPPSNAMKFRRLIPLSPARAVEPRDLTTACSGDHRLRTGFGGCLKASTIPRSRGMYMIGRREIVLVGTAAAVVAWFTRLSNSAMAQAVSQETFEIVKSDEEWGRELTTEPNSTPYSAGT